MYEIPQWAIMISGGVLSFMMGGNIYFVKRLVDRIDSTANLVQEIQIDVAVLCSKINKNTNKRNYPNA